jgi:hypothetical protein
VSEPHCYCRDRPLEFGASFIELSLDLNKSPIDADLLPEDVKAKILAIVQEAVRKHGGE